MAMKKRRVRARTAAAATTTKRVDVKLTGGFFHGWVKVAGTSISLGPTGEGGTTVTLTSPSVNVDMGLSASGAVEYTLCVTINGVSKTEKDTIDGGTFSKTFTYPTKDFNL